MNMFENLFARAWPLLKHLGKRLALFFLVALFSGGALAADPPPIQIPVLTQEQMRQDYDRFASIVQDVFPLTEANRLVYGTDVPKILESGRARLKEITTTEQFVELIHTIIVACRGSHFYVGCTANAPGDKYFEGFVADDAYALAKTYNSLLAKFYGGNGLDVPLMYYHGSYYTAHDFDYEGKSYPKGMKVLACGGKSPEDIIRTLTMSGALRYWDYELNQNYTSQFYKFCPLATNQPLTMRFEKADGANLEIAFEFGKQVKYHAPQNPRGALVTLVNSNILYIRLPMMDNNLGSFWQRELAKYRSQPIQKVVVDIRHNPGGGDPAWMDLLKLLVRTNLNRHTKLGVKDTQINRAYLAHSPLGEYMARYGRNEKISFLNNEEFRTLSPGNLIKPATNSLGLTCKLFVLSEDVYSAAGNLLHWSAQNEQLVSVGIPNGLLLGQGMPPFAFSLPNSKLIFTIEPLIDLTDARTARDTHHIDLKVTIKPALDEMLDYNNVPDDMELQKRLNEHDPWFKKVLELPGG